ncbi:MFS transporter [Nonomuraea mangrovi]|uniref:Tetracycline resistance protein n=1 Tax=Nonomuraea mangrovi TaxID=2316207 RepID=A0ABW4TDK7_9ACTN
MSHSLADPATRGQIGTLSTALRLGALFGPSVFGVTAAGVALPEVAAALRSGPAAVAWVITAHALALGVGTAVFGRIADTRGIRTALLAGAAVLGAGAFVCVVAPGLGALVAGRLVLATGSGAMAAAGVALLAGVEPERRPRVLAGYGMVMATFAAGATLVGGVVTTWLSWRVTLVLPVLSLPAVPACLPLVRRAGSRGPLDVTGAALLTVTVSTLLVLIQGRSLRLEAPVVAALAVVAVATAGALAWWTRGRPEGFLPHTVIASGAFWVAVAIGVGVFGGLFATMYAVPQLLTGAHGWSVLAVGAALLPGAAVGALLSRRAGLLDAGKARGLLVGTALAAGVALAAAAVTGAAGGWLLVAAASLSLAAFAVTQVVLTGEMSARLAPQARGMGMGLLNLAFFVGGAAGSALTGALSGPLGLVRTLAVVAVFPLAAATVAFTTRR